MEKFKYDPPEGFNDASAYPNPTSEAATREQFQRPHDQMAAYLNKVLTTLGSEVIMLRLNDDLGIEYSTDGKSWRSTLAGHIVMDESGAQYPIRSRLQFVNAVVEDNPDTGCTVIHGNKGEAGPGVPTGGTLGQILTKNSDNPFDTCWTDPIRLSNECNSDESEGVAATPKAVKTVNDIAVQALSMSNQLIYGVANCQSIVAIPQVSTTIESGMDDTFVDLFTVRRSGLYFIYAYAQFGSTKSGGFRNARLSTQTGGIKIQSVEGVPENEQFALNDAIYLAAGESVQLAARQTSGEELALVYGGRYSFIPM